MAKQDLSITKKKEWAKQLYIQDEYTQKEIAQKVDVAEKTISKWVNDGNWDVERKSLLVTTSQILRDLIETLDAMRKEAKVFATDDDPATKPDSDGIYKMSLAIKKLQDKAGIGETILTLQSFVKFVRIEDLDLAKQITTYADLFIEDRLKNS